MRALLFTMLLLATGCSTAASPPLLAPQPAAERTSTVEPTSTMVAKPTLEALAVAADGPPTIGLPFHLDDLLLDGGAWNPFGIVRFSLDRPEYGHSGIDVPLRAEAALLAVADGEVARIEAVQDGLGGAILVLRFNGDAPTGEGRGFIYEHIEPGPGIEAGVAVGRGQALGVTAIAPLAGNNHLQLTYLFHDLRYYRDHSCWLEHLDRETAAALEAAFATAAASPSFLELWRSDEREGRRPFAALLDPERYPEGPRLCYPPGTDARD